MGSLCSTESPSLVSLCYKESIYIAVFWHTHTVLTFHTYRMTDFMTESALRAEQDAEFGYEVQPSERLLQGEQLPPFNPIISGMNGEEPEGSGPFLPLWQMTPILPVMDILNFNVLSHPAVQGGFLAALKSALAVIDVSTNLETSDDGTTQTIANMALQLSQYRHDFSQFASDPSTAM